MPDDAGDRTEQPTARRREEARKEGRVPRSQDLTASVGLTAGLVLLSIFGKQMLDGFLFVMQDLGEPIAGDGGDLVIPLTRAARTAAMLLLPFLLGLLVVTVVGTFLQFGGVFTPKKVQPNFSNLSPLKGAKNIFSKQAVVRLLLGLLKMGIVGVVAYTTIVGQIGPVLTAGGLHSWGILDMASNVCYTLALRLAIALLVLGIADYVWQRYSTEQSLKMTKQEVKDEMKNMDGDPQVKRRQREVQMRVAMQRINAAVPKADVVVTNPTHFSVALRYDEDSMDAPRVVAKGKDFLALRIRQLAQTHGVPVVERPPLARALYAQVEPGDEIPPELYKAVAEVLAYVYQLSGRAAKAG